jgi:four helix bundle protein
MNSYKDLIVWQKSFALSKEVYRITMLFPKSEMYGLGDQLRRASVSIVSNIAEGFSRKSVLENLRFNSIAFGSTSEVETQLLLAKELEFAPPKDFFIAENLLMEVRKMLNAMRVGLRKRATND